jgi:putative aldouronate transport system permease protein
MRFHKRSASRMAFDVFNVLLMLAIAFACVAPIWHVLMSSVSDPLQLTTKSGILLWPAGEINFKGYEIVFASSSGIITGYINTIFYVITGVGLGTIMTILAGYGLSRRNLLWGGPIMFFLSVTMLFSGGLIPFYMVVRGLNMINTRWAMIIPGCVSVFNIIIMRTAFFGLPDSLEESAKMDGAGHLTIMFRIVVPLAKSTIAVVVLFYAIGMWNSWFNASIFITKRDLFPLQLFLREILIKNDTSTVMTSAAETVGLTNLYRNLVKYCTIVAATVPVLCFYPFAQKYFVTGVLIGSIKG